MDNQFYYIYCKGILGVKTNDAGFKWMYGSVAPQSSYQEYEKCLVKIDVCIKPEKKLGEVVGCDKKFQSYNWNSKTKTIYCRRKILGGLRIGFNIEINRNTIRAEFGRNYYHFVRNRTMNLHGVHYLLADLANILLLRNGFISLYASAVHNEESNKGIVCFAPPNTGKTVTASKLCELLGYKLVGEDIVIADDRNIYSCPWTSSYRKHLSVMDDAGSLGRIRKSMDISQCDTSNLTDIVVLSLGKNYISDDKKEILHRICILNGYLFCHYSSPIVKILAYFDAEYRKTWGIYAESMLEDMSKNCSCYLIQAESPMDFYEIINKKNQRH